jgi:D-erythronate 2-dehydrogenase
MKILITGGAGFLGQQLSKRLLEQGYIELDGSAHPIDRLVAFDVVAGAYQHPKLEYRTGDISDPICVSALVDPQTRVVVHLAAVVSGTAEADFDLGMRVNVDGTRAVLEACRATGSAPRVLFASSVASFGVPLPEVVNDATTPIPQASYGVQKLLGELLVQDYSRKGFIDGRSVRVPTVVVRPGKPNGAASSFASGMIREPLNGQPSPLPVTMNTSMWCISTGDLIDFCLHALGLPASAWGSNRSLNLPGMTVSMTEALSALEAVGGPTARALVTEQFDPVINKIVSTWPSRFDTARANAMGFKCQRNFLATVKEYQRSLGDA